MEDTIDFKKIDKARKTLGLRENVTLREIKKAYKELAKEYHPDKCGKKKKKICEEKIKEINAAYKLIIAYCESYRYSLTKTAVEDAYSKYLKGFQEDWMWGPGKIEEGGRKDDYCGI